MQLASVTLSTSWNISKAYKMFKLLISFIVLNYVYSAISADETSLDAALPQPPYCGGKSADIGSIPWLVYVLHRPIFSTEDTRCAGTLINSRWVLTAAHCVVGFEKFVELGDKKTARIEKKILHPEFNENNKLGKNDLALLRLSNAVDYTQKVQPICLPLTKNAIQISENDDNQAIDVVYWNHTNGGDGESQSDTMERSSFKILKAELCEKQQASNNVPFEKLSQICGHSDHCLENAGAFLQIQKQEVNYQIGLMTYAGGKCHGTDGDVDGDVFNRIDAYVDWIAEVIKTNQ